MGSNFVEARIPIVKFANLDLSTTSPGNQSSPVTKKNNMLLGKELHDKNTGKSAAIMLHSIGTDNFTQAETQSMQD